MGLEKLFDELSAPPAGEHPAQTATELARKAGEPASELSVEEGIRAHEDRCRVARMVRRWGLIISFAAGAGFVAQLLLPLVSQARMEKTVNAAVDRVIAQRCSLSAANRSEEPVPASMSMSLVPVAKAAP